MAAPRRTYTQAEVQRAIVEDRESQEARATKEAMAEFMAEEKQWRRDHGESHEKMANGIVEIREELRAINLTAVIVDDPAVREALPDMAREWINTRTVKKRDRQLLTGWAGRVTFLTVAGSFVLLALTSLGVLPPKAPAPVRSPAPLISGSPHP